MTTARLGKSPGRALDLAVVVVSTVAWSAWMNSPSNIHRIRSDGLIGSSCQRPQHVWTRTGETWQDVQPSVILTPQALEACKPLLPCEFLRVSFLIRPVALYWLNDRRPDSIWPARICMRMCSCF